MKNLCVIVLAAGLVLSLIGCATSGGAAAPAPVPAASTPAPAAPVLGGMPPFVRDAYLNASEDVLIGVGMYTIGNDRTKMNTGKTFAETRARPEITRQLQSIMKDMVNDYTATSELDPGASISFQENITQALAKADLRGAKTVALDVVDGVIYVVMEYGKSNAASDYSAATAAAKLAVPAAAAFDAISRMDTAFNKAAAGGPVPAGD